MDEHDLIIAKKIIKLSLKLNHKDFISNREIYKYVCGMQRFSYHWWQSLEINLKRIALNTNQIKLDNHAYILYPYAPMSKNNYNFVVNNNWVGGFQVILKEQKDGK